MTATGASASARKEEQKQGRAARRGEGRSRLRGSELAIELLDPVLSHVCSLSSSPSPP